MNRGIKRDFFKCYSVVDERSAAYVAIGIYLQNRNPVALICTSAQATRNYVPGLTEAFYKGAPILSCLIGLCGFWVVWFYWFYCPSCATINPNN